jgi:hypothetical protein
LVYPSHSPIFQLITNFGWLKTIIISGVITMKLKFTGFLLIAVVTIFSLAAWTEHQADPAEPGIITVSGDAEVRVVPDEVVLTLGIETWHKNLNTAKQQNDERVKAVLDLAKRYGIEPQHIQTDHISIEPRYDDYNRAQLTGYFVRKTIVIILKDLSKFEDLLTDSLEAGANYVHGVQFRTTQLRQYRDQARALAINAAQEKATTLAAELEQKVGQPRTIREDQIGWWSWYNMWWGSYRGRAMSQNVIQEDTHTTYETENAIAPGQITVNARVTVSFEFE